MKLAVATIQMPAEPSARDSNLERADDLLRQAWRSGAEFAVLPEMFNTGYGVLSDYGALSEPLDGPTMEHLADRSRAWGMTIAGGFVERDGHHLYDSLGLCLPDGRRFAYRKRNLVFWEGFRFRPGRAPLIVNTPWGRVGLAVCADMIYRKVWADYRGRIDLAVVAAAWPEFADRETGRRHWLLGHVGPLSAKIPGKVAHDLKVPVAFANQCGATRTRIPLLHSWISDRFAGRSSISDGLHGPPVVAGLDEEVLLASVTLHHARGPLSCRSTSRSVTAVSSSASAP